MLTPTDLARANTIVMEVSERHPYPDTVVDRVDGTVSVPEESMQALRERDERFYEECDRLLGEALGIDFTDYWLYSAARAPVAEITPAL